MFKWLLWLFRIKRKIHFEGEWRWHTDAYVENECCSFVELWVVLNHYYYFWHFQFDWIDLRLAIARRTHTHDKKWSDLSSCVICEWNQPLQFLRLILFYFILFFSLNFPFRFWFVWISTPQGVCYYWLFSFICLNKTNNKTGIVWIAKTKSKCLFDLFIDCAEEFLEKKNKLRGVHSSHLLYILVVFVCLVLFSFLIALKLRCYDLFELLTWKNRTNNIEKCSS